MFGLSINGKHGLQAIAAGLVSVLAIAQQAAQLGLLTPKVTAIVASIGTIIAVFSNKPGVPKAQ